MLQHDQEGFVAKVKHKTQSEMTAKLLDIKMSGAFLYSVKCEPLLQKKKQGAESQLY